VRPGLVHAQRLEPHLRVDGLGVAIQRACFLRKMVAVNDMARPCTFYECRLLDAMLQLSPHGEIAIPMGGIDETTPHAVKGQSLRLRLAARP